MHVDIEFERKKAAALLALQERVSEAEWQYMAHWPLRLRLQWKIGLKTKPIYFNSFLGEIVQVSIRLGPLFCLGFSQSLWSYSGHSISMMVWILFLLIFAVSSICAWGIGSFARKKQLPSWESL